MSHSSEETSLEEQIEQVTQEMLNIFVNYYLDKREISFRLSDGIQLEPFWECLTKKRFEKAHQIELLDQTNRTFWYNVPSHIRIFIEGINDTALTGIKNNLIKTISEEIIREALIDEAFSSSVIEGAFTTRKRTKELVERNEPPKNLSEQMVVNNYRALEFILENLDKPLNEETVLHIHKIIMEKTLEPGEACGEYRTGEVDVVNSRDEVVYLPPDFTRVKKMMDDLFRYIHNLEDKTHPLIKAAILHFYFVYVHPFFDGNGRTARAITYMYLLQNGYKFFHIFSTSTIIYQQREKYYRSIKQVEDYDSDLTYFISSFLEMTLVAMQTTMKKIIKQAERKFLLQELERRGIELNPRQYKIIRYMLQKDGNLLLLKDYQKQTRASLEEAESDLEILITLDLFEKIEKENNKAVYQFHGLKKISGTSSQKNTDS